MKVFHKNATLYHSMDHLFQNHLFFFFYFRIILTNHLKFHFRGSIPDLLSIFLLVGPENCIGKEASWVILLHIQI